MIQKVIKAALFVSNEPLSVAKMLGAFEGQVERKDVQQALDELRESLDETRDALEIVEVAGGFQMVTRTDVKDYLERLKDKKKKAAISAAALETLAIIAYRQPVARQDIEMIRGVSASGVVHTLLERRLIKITGRSEAPGKPFLYGTTKNFLEYFGLPSLKELPDVAELGKPMEAIEAREAAGAAEGDTGEDADDTNNESVAQDEYPGGGETAGAEQQPAAEEVAVETEGPEETEKE